MKVNNMKSYSNLELLKVLKACYKFEAYKNLKTPQG